MVKRKKTHVDYVLEREIRHAYGVLDDLKFIRELYREDRQEQAYGFSLMTVKATEELALNVRHLAVSLNASDAEKDVRAWLIRLTRWKSVLQSTNISA